MIEIFFMKVFQSMFEKDFLQDVHHNLWMIAEMIFQAGSKDILTNFFRISRCPGNRTAIRLSGFCSGSIEGRCTCQPVLN